MTTITDKQKSILAMILSSFGFALMGVFIKLTGDIPTIQKVVFRTYIIMATVFIMMKYYGVSLKGIKHWKLLTLRSILGTGGIILNYYALDQLLLSDASVLFRLSTFILLFFSWIFLKEKIAFYQFAAVAVAFVGVLLIIQPGFQVAIGPYLIAIGGATLAAGAYTVVRALGKKEKPLVVVFFFAAFTSVVLTPMAIINFQPMTMMQVVFAILTGISAAVGQVGVTYAYKHAPAKEVSIYNYFGVIFSTIFSIFIFDTLPDSLSIIGYVVIFISSFYMWRKSQKQ